MYASLNLLYSIEIEFQLNIKISSSDVIATNGITSGIVDEILLPSLQLNGMSPGLAIECLEWDQWMQNRRLSLMMN